MQTLVGMYEILTNELDRRHRKDFHVAGPIRNAFAMISSRLAVPTLIDPNRSGDCGARDYGETA